jgi:hypothetical protein
MNPIRSMADGQIYDSRSAYYASVKRAGCEVVGDDRDGFGSTPGYQGEGVEQAIKDSIEQLHAGTARPVAPGPAVLGGWD